MDETTQWRGFDLRPRMEKIKRAFRCEPVVSAEDFPVLVNSPCYFSFGSRDKPTDYYTNPASMLEYQACGYEKHLQLVDDDYVPYFMPWYGTGVLASAFGAPIRVPADPADDPAVAETCIKSLADVGRLKMPDPYRDGWMPRVLDTIDYAVAHGDLPVGLTDMQGPLGTIGLMCGQAQLYQWMYNEPAAMHDLFDIVTEAFIEWVKIQKRHIGEPLESSNGLQGVYSPDCGVWESDDDLVLVNAHLYREFVTPCVERIFTAFSGGSVHFCGNGVQHIDNLKSIGHLKVINNSPLGNFEAFTSLAKAMEGRVTIQIQDASPVNVEEYYARLFAGIDDFRGLMLAPFVMDNTGMDGTGGYIPVEWDPFETANRVVKSVRANIARRLSGEPTLAPQQEATRVSIPVDKKIEAAATTETRLTDQQTVAIERIRFCLVEFDQKGIKLAVQVALDAGLRPFDIIIHGMAQGMEDVGKLYEQGDYYLPELVMAGATMKDGMSVLQPIMAGEGGAGAASKGKIVLGTVQGDMHDIGKNLVRTMLEGASFQVVDLGVDVSPEKFIEAAKAENAQIIALSALLTTTLKGMKLTVEALQAAGLRDRVHVMIGGAPVSNKYAEQIGADGYASTAVGAVREAERLLSLG